MPRNIILYAEDNDGTRELLSEILEEEFINYKIESKSSGTQLEKRLEKNVSDVALVITDNFMPGIDGSCIIEKYSRKKEFEEIPFILLYGGAEEIGKKAVENGAFGYLLKDSIHLIDKVDKIVDEALKNNLIH